MHYCAGQRSAAQYSTVEYCAGHRSALQYSTAQYSTEQCRTICCQKYSLLPEAVVACWCLLAQGHHSTELAQAGSALRAEAEVKATGLLLVTGWHSSSTGSMQWGSMGSI